MGIYILKSDVMVRLQGKVRFTDDSEDQNKMSYALLERLIDDAESQVELDLSPRYSAPFQTKDGEPFSKLPDRPTKRLLRTLCERKACMLVLSTDYGRGSAISGDEYFKNLKANYEELLKLAVGREKLEKDRYGAFSYPPLPGLRLNYMNEKADDGFAGMVLVHSGRGDGDFPSKQIQDPSENFWNGEIDE